MPWLFESTKNIPAPEKKKKLEEAIRSDLVSNLTQPLATVNNEACDTGAVPGGHHVPSADIPRMSN